MLAVRADSPWQSVKDFVEDAKKRPKAINYGSSGNYGTNSSIVQNAGYQANPFASAVALGTLGAGMYGAYGK